MTGPEFSRLVDVRQSDRKHMRLEANEAERAALARRFALVRIDRLHAELDLDRDGSNVGVTGRLSADIVQSCAVSGDDLPVTIDEPVTMRFIPASAAGASDLELEIDSSEIDEIEYEGSEFDLGEAVAQTMALNIDPFATGPQAEKARRAAGLSDAAKIGSFGELLSKKLK